MDMIQISILKDLFKKKDSNLQDKGFESFKRRSENFGKKAKGFESSTKEFESLNANLEQKVGKRKRIRIHHLGK